MRTTGYDTSGEPVTIGDTDADGYEVGYIDDGGLAWESRRERDSALLAGYFSDAWRKWATCGGLVGKEPRPEQFLGRVGVAPENRQLAIHEAWRDVAFMVAVARLHRRCR